MQPATDSEGCLQDVHWAVGSFGYFPSYVLGSLIAAQMFESLRAQSEHIDADIAAGRFGGLSEWLRQNVHARGASVSAQELIREATGKPLTAAPWLRYAEAKYLEDAADLADTAQEAAAAPADETRVVPVAAP